MWNALVSLWLLVLVSQMSWHGLLKAQQLVKHLQCQWWMQRYKTIQDVEDQAIFPMSREVWQAWRQQALSCQVQ